MKRIDGIGSGPFGPPNPDDDKRRARESVLSNLMIFGFFCGLIRAAPFVIRQLQS